MITELYAKILLGKQNYVNHLVLIAFITSNKLFIYSLNRSLRKYTYQMILMNEFKKTGKNYFYKFPKFNNQKSELLQRNE